MGENDNVNKKFLLKNGRQLIDYLFKAGFGLGFCIGEAVKCRFKAGLETDHEKQERLMVGCNWYIDKLAKEGNMVREEIVNIVKAVVADIENDKILTEGVVK